MSYLFIETSTQTTHELCEPLIRTLDIWRKAGTAEESATFHRWLAGYIAQLGPSRQLVVNLRHYAPLSATGTKSEVR